MRFLQLQHRAAERDTGDGRYQLVDELTTPAGSWLSWDEAVEVELPFGPFGFADASRAVDAAGDGAAGQRYRSGRGRPAGADQGGASAVN